MLSKNYLANPRLSQSKLKLILDGVDIFKYGLDNPIEQTEAMKLGTLVHLLVLEPHKINCVVCLPKINMTTRSGKIWGLIKAGKKLDHFKVTENKTKKQTEFFYEVDQEEHDFAREFLFKFGDHFDAPEGKLFVSQEDFEKASKMAASVRANSDARLLLESATDFEHEILYRHKEIDFKCQVDAMDFECVLDLKTTNIMNNPHEIKREIYNRRYHFQAASYLLASKRIKYYIIFVRSEAPFSCFPVELSQETLDAGQELFDSACDIFNECLKTNQNFIADNKIILI